MFSRFCNEDRKEIGDIDIDCVESDRPAIFKYITDRFGEDKTARVASFGTMQAKGAIDDIGRCLAQRWSQKHGDGDNPWSLQKIAKIKSEFDVDSERTKQKYPELFYYFGGLFDTKISQSVHPAGMVISPITLVDNFGVFDKDNEMCLMDDNTIIQRYLSNPITKAIVIGGLEPFDTFIRIAVRNGYQCRIWHDGLTLVIEYNYQDEGMSGTSLQWVGENEYVEKYDTEGAEE